ncbi:MFS transporter [Caulobacter sp. CCUG 60055]|uniref:MFS transporter n=1 Tax=Caulobacter sp. CCUG 60055 TaxID=2100090 RepID=UPI001FA7EE9B|nr:MFS transporter [Caulobacter sp. CCUG 60055]
MSRAHPPAPALSRGETAAYAVGSFANGVFSTVPTVLLLYFCTETLGVPAAWAAAAVFAPKAWAIFWDPFVGAWSDRTRSRFGRRRPFLAAGCVGLPLAFAALFWAPVHGPVAGFLWAAGGYFLLATLYSLFAVPHSAVPAEIGAEPAQRARLVGWRMTAAMVGVLAGAGGAPVLIQAFGGGRAGYAAMGVCVAVLCMAAMVSPLVMLRRHDRPAAANAGRPAPAPLIGQLRLAFSDADFRRLGCAFLLQLTAVGAVSAAAPYIVVGAFGRPEGDVGTAMGALLVATILSVPVWSWLGRRYGESRMLGVAAAGYAAAALAVGAATMLHVAWPVAVACFTLAGAPFAGLQVLPFTLAAHVAHAASRERGAANGEADGIEGVFTGVWTSIEKLGLALGPALTAVVLSFTGKTGPAIAGFVALAPAALALASMIFLNPSRAADESLEPSA